MPGTHASLSIPAPYTVAVGLRDFSLAQGPEISVLEAAGRTGLNISAFIDMPVNAEYQVCKGVKICHSDLGLGCWVASMVVRMLTTIWGSCQHYDLISFTSYRYLQNENNKLLIIRVLVLSSSKFFILLLYIIRFF